MNNASGTMRRSSIVIPSVLTALMIALTLGLGIWQVQRRAEKHALIAALTERLAAPAVALPAPSTWNNFSPVTDEFRRVTLSATMDAGRDARVFGSGSAVRTDISGAGIWVFTRVRMPDGRSVVVNRGFVPDADRARYDSEAARPAAVPSTIIGYIRFPESAGLLTPSADIAKRLWFARDIGDMARGLGWGEVAPFYIDMESPVPPSGLPKPGPLQPNLRDDHMQYVITWFGLAIAIAVAFGFWLSGRRRPATPVKGGV